MYANVYGRTEERILTLIRFFFSICTENKAFRSIQNAP